MKKCILTVQQMNKSNELHSELTKVIEKENNATFQDVASYLVEKVFKLSNPPRGIRKVFDKSKKLIFKLEIDGAKIDSTKFQTRLNMSQHNEREIVDAIVWMCNEVANEMTTIPAGYSDILESVN